MKRVFAIMLAGILIAAFAGTVRADDSLGDVARKYRKTPKSKAVKVYDNENLPRSAPISLVGIVQSPPDATADGDANDGGNPAKTGGKEAGQSGAKDEQGKNDSAAADARQKALQQLKDDVEKQRAKIADITHELDLLTREYRLRTALYYSDAGYRLRSPQTWAEEDLAYRNKIAAKEAELSAAQAKLGELEETARKAGMTSKGIE